MPGFESLILGEKTAVVFDIGSAYTKCGFAGESGPRFIFPTQVTQRDGRITTYRSLSSVKEKKAFLVAFFYQLYYRHLLVNPKDRRVVIVESVLCTSESRELIGDVLFKHFEIPSALFAPAHLVTLFTLGLSSGLVLDCGLTEAVVIPVFEGYTLLNSWQAGQLGSKTIYSPSSRAAEWAEWSNAVASGEDMESVPSPKVTEAKFIYPLNNVSEGKRLEIPSRLRELSVECLFRGDNDHTTLATLLLRSIQKSPIDSRRMLAQNIILIGGTVNIPGFITRLLEELDIYLEQDEFANLAALKNTFRIHETPAESNYTAWLGGAIFGALECLPGRSIERNVYLEKGCNLPDWTSCIDTNDASVMAVSSNPRAEATRQ